jgi:transcriptional regulator with XRE-family HTH domain
LRKTRRWSQDELASKLELSQSRLSELERGEGSFTAEQFIEVLSLFNVTVRDFEPGPVRDSEDDIQQALARYGANYLVQPDATLPTEQLADLHELVASALLSPSPRLVAALAPVLITNVDRINLSRVSAQLAALGLQNRLAWVIDNSLHAINSPHWGQLRLLGRCYVVWTNFLATAPRPDGTRDVLDRTIRSTKTLEKVEAASSDISKRWGIVTAMTVDDFSEAIEQSHVLDQ